MRDLLQKNENKMSEICPGYSLNGGQKPMCSLVHFDQCRDITTTLQHNNMAALVNLWTEHSPLTPTK